MTTKKKRLPNRIDEAFARRKALICYAPLGDPKMPGDLLDIYAECGVDIVEVGLPTPDAYMDGEVIASSMRRAFEAGVSPRDVAHGLKLVNGRHGSLARIVMCYDTAKLGNFRSLIRTAGLDGFLMVGFGNRKDAGALVEAMAAENTHHIGFISYDVTDEELKRAKSASGYIMLQAFGGKTGARDEPLSPSLETKIRRIRKAGIKIPIALGFGVSSADHARQAVALGADGIISGSAPVKHALKSKRSLTSYLKSLRRALDEA